MLTPIYQRSYGASCLFKLLFCVSLPLLNLIIACDRNSLAVSIGMENEIPLANLTVIALIPIT